MLLPKEVELAVIRIREIESEIENLKNIIDKDKITWQEEKKLQYVLSEYRRLRDEKKELEAIIKEIIKLINKKKRP